MRRPPFVSRAAVSRAAVSRAGALLAGVLLVGAFAVPASAADGNADGDGVGDKGFTIEDSRITESSGLAASRLHPGVYWTHNDSDDGPYLYAVDSATGKTVARLTLTGIGSPRDVEAISIGPDNQIYVGDIGDNLGGNWPYVWIYRLPEPKTLTDQTVRATQYIVKYSDGARDAESLVVHPRTGRVYIIDKKEDGGHLYEGPATLSASGANVFKPVAAVDLWATDAAFSPDGARLAVRGYFGGIYYDFNGGDLERKGRLDVPLQRQGESVSYSADGAKLLYGTEGSGSSVVAEDAPGGGTGGDSKSPSGGGGSGAAADGGSSSATGGVKLGALAFAVLCVAVFGFGRLLRRKS
ncbi:WD40 repeat domain-containing protein [Streptomyces sp. NBC_01275]|uniref:WD40 repeat domain-containing protein n=1 Tax=Streptomyces sp. NBC_01275 TaxID=2903807 RepID=UPI0022546437|nr:WD40 repeat domain-containing protein [Streptomyces sp. NBC_01275]MCX4763021.1 WD40 repeat domain-containing protein [Streptomyces sp. NBC_01275]